MKKVHKDFDNIPGLELARIVARVCLEKKAEDLVILDVRGISSFADYFVIMSGRSTRHVQGLAQVVDEELRRKRLDAEASEGYNEGRWILLDYNDVVVHIFYGEVRSFYDLEGLWHDAPRVAVQEPAPASGEQGA
jgi:ribosome-associated protein